MYITKICMIQIEQKDYNSLHLSMKALRSAFVTILVIDPFPCLRISLKTLYVALTLSFNVTSPFIELNLDSSMSWLLTTSNMISADMSQTWKWENKMNFLNEGDSFEFKTIVTVLNGLRAGAIHGVTAQIMTANKKKEGAGSRPPLCP